MAKVIWALFSSHILFFCVCGSWGHQEVHHLPKGLYMDTGQVCLCHNLAITLIRHAHFCWSSFIYSGGSLTCTHTHKTLYPPSRYPPYLCHIVLWANINLLNMFLWIICSKNIWKIQSVSENFLAYSELPISKMYILWYPNNSLILDALRWVL